MYMYATNAKANAGLTTGIIGTAGFGLTALANLANNMMGRCNGNPDDTAVNRYELQLSQQVEAERAENALLKSQIYTDQKIVEAYKDLNNKIESNTAAIAQQAVYNATVNSTLACIQGQIAQLYGLTKLVVPNTSVCPGWGNVTVAPATATAG
jgi:hypothetical protein